MSEYRYMLNCRCAEMSDQRRTNGQRGAREMTSRGKQNEDKAIGHGYVGNYCFGRLYSSTAPTAFAGCTAASCAASARQGVRLRLIGSGWLSSIVLAHGVAARRCSGRLDRL